MPSETEIILSFIFKRSGKQKLDFSEMYLALSIDLNWFTPEDAKAFIKKTINNKLLIKEEEAFKPSFDCDKIIVPVGFSPSKQVFKEKITQKSDKKEEELIDKIIEYLIAKTQLEPQQIKEKIIKISNTKNITIEIAATLLAKEYDITLEDFFDQIEDNIFTENKE